MLTLNDGRTELWQWDTGRTLAVDADCSQVHFSNKVFGRSIDVDVIDGVSIIPDILLQTDKELTAWAFAGTPENGYTKISKTFKVNRRNKPADYVFTPTEQTTLGELVERLEKIEESQDPDAIKNAVDDYLANNQIEIDETDPTVSEWAKQPQKPAYTAQEVGALPATTPIPSTAADVNAEPSGAVAQHNVSDAAHSDIRLLIQGLSERLSAVADSDDTSLDQLSEIVAYIKSNKSLIDAITTSKVNVADIVDDLVTNVANKPLSAAQGVALKALIDALTIPTALSDLTEDTTHRVVTDAEKAVWNAKSNFTGSYNDLTDKPTIPDVPVQSVNGKTGAVELSAGDVGALPDSTVIPEAYTLPIASSTQLGGVKPVTKTDAMTQSVGVDEAGGLWAPAASGGGSGGEIVDIFTINIDEEVATLTQELTEAQREAIKECDEIFLTMHIVVPTTAPSDAQGKVTANFLGYNSGGSIVHRFRLANDLQCIQKSGISVSKFSDVYMVRELTSFDFFRQYHDVIVFQNQGQSVSNVISATVNAPFTASNVAKNAFEATASSAFGAGSYFTLRGKRWA